MYDEAADKQHCPYHDTCQRCEQYVQQLNPLIGPNEAHRSRCAGAGVAERDGSLKWAVLPHAQEVPRGESPSPLCFPHEASIPAAGAPPTSGA